MGKMSWRKNIWTSRLELIMYDIRKKSPQFQPRAPLLFHNHPILVWSLIINLIISITSFLKTPSPPPETIFWKFPQNLCEWDQYTYTMARFFDRTRNICKCQKNKKTERTATTMTGIELKTMNISTSIVKNSTLRYVLTRVSSKLYFQTPIDDLAVVQRAMDTQGNWKKLLRIPLRASLMLCSVSLLHV